MPNNDDDKGNILNMLQVLGLVMEEAGLPVDTLIEIATTYTQEKMEEAVEAAERLNTVVSEVKPQPWTNAERPAPQVHFRVNVSGLKRVPDATFTMDGDMRDVDIGDFFAAHDIFQAEVDKRYPLPDAKVEEAEK